MFTFPCVTIRPQKVCKKQHFLHGQEGLFAAARMVEVNKISAGKRPQAARLLRSWVRIPPGAWIFVCCECRVFSGRGLCDELITRPEESYGLCCVVVCNLETSRIGVPYIYDISNLRVKISLYNPWYLRNFKFFWKHVIPYSFISL